MPRRPSPLVVALVLALGIGAGGAGGSTPPRAEVRVVAASDSIFRYVTIGLGVDVRLGEPLPLLARPWIRQTGPRVYVARDGAFSGAREIRFHLRPDGRVSSVSFTYDPHEEDFRTKVAGYAGSLGRPEMRDRPGHRVARWSDGRTRFEVVERGGRLEASLIDADPAAEPADARADDAVRRSLSAPAGRAAGTSIPGALAGDLSDSHGDPLP